MYDNKQLHISSGDESIFLFISIVYCKMSCQLVYVN